MIPLNCRDQGVALRYVHLYKPSTVSWSSFGIEQGRSSKRPACKTHINSIVKAARSARLYLVTLLMFSMFLTSVPYKERQPKAFESSCKRHRARCRSRKSPQIKARRPRADKEEEEEVLVLRYRLVVTTSIQNIVQQVIDTPTHRPYLDADGRLWAFSYLDVTSRPCLRVAPRPLPRWPSMPGAFSAQRAEDCHRQCIKIKQMEFCSRWVKVQGHDYDDDYDMTTTIAMSMTMIRYV